MTDSASSGPPPSRLNLASHPSRTPPAIPTPTPAAASTAPTTPKPPPRRRHPPLSLRDWIIRAVAWSLLAGAASLVLWTYRQLVPVQKQVRETGTLVSRLTSDISLMEGKYTPADLEQLAQEYSAALELLFSTPESLTRWLQEVRAQSIPLALETTPEFSLTETNTHTLTNTASPAFTPATLSLVMHPSAALEGVRPSYERILRFLGELGRQSKRVDLIELHVHGGSNSVSRAVATLKLWVGAEAGP